MNSIVGEQYRDARKAMTTLHNDQLSVEDGMSLREVANIIKSHFWLVGEE